jgi:hypothetical protein
MNVLLSLVVLAIHSIAIGVALGALVGLDAPIQVRILILAAFLLLTVLIAHVSRLVSSARRLEFWLRTTFVSLENFRLDASEKTPALDLVTKDMTREEAMRAAERSLASGFGVLAFWFVCLAYVALLVLSFLLTVAGLHIS